MRQARSELSRLSAACHLGPEETAWLDGVDAVVPSPGVPRDNKLLVEAARRGIEVLSEIELAARFGRAPMVAITGTNGKTTTTRLVAGILEAAGLRVFAGGNIGKPLIEYADGTWDWGVVEVSSFQLEWVRDFRPRVALCLNLSEDHLDRYDGLASYGAAKARIFAAQHPDDVAVLNRDDPWVWGLREELGARVVSFGWSEVEDLSGDADFSAEGVRTRQMESTFTVLHQRRLLGPVTLPMPGRHSVANALAAIAVAAELGIDFTAAAAALGAFAGIHRRSEIKGEVAGVLVMDDYGHHPTEIETTLQAIAEGWGRPLTVVFQPHRYSRTKDLFEDFVSAFDRVHRLILTDVYGAGEDPIPGTSGEELCRAIRRRGHMDVEFVAAKEDVAGGLLPRLSDGDMVLTLGAGDIYKVGEALLESLREQRQ
ncbi:UDP-N-acetylmuramate--L-alanine ligase [Geodia barretti]|uniref:UDP-N-acetylmuramate--L-alanine ligase n=1 Tax=Geodia barretti TaxID=519541 RepID=A0AA35QRD2_GEOBA|nr:UDP-N-acetylmuramate--L-alanine ligase [Geodia barretti]